MKLARLPSLLKEAVSDWSEDKASRLAAALAYYTAFSIVPLLVITVFLAGLVIGEEAASGGIVRELSSMIGQESADFFQGLVQNSRKSGSGLMAAVGVVLLVLGATGVFGQLKDGLDTIWEVAPKKGKGVARFLKDRFLSFAMVTGVAFLLLVSLALSAALGAVTRTIGESFAGQKILLGALDVVVSTVVITLLFALIYKLLPDVKMAWKDVWLGAVFTAVLFTLGKFAIGFYLGHGSVGSSFGAGGALAILLIWVYYAANIFFLGAELTQVYANRFGSKILPADDAVPVTREARAQQGMPPAALTKPAPRALPAERPVPPDPRPNSVPRAVPGSMPLLGVLAGFVAGVLAATAAGDVDPRDLDPGGAGDPEPW